MLATDQGQVVRMAMQATYQGQVLRLEKVSVGFVSFNLF